MFPHLVSAGKYASSIVAISVAYKYNLNSDDWFTSYCFFMWATMYSMLWDFRMDWGIFRSINKKLGLRSRRLYPDKFYYIAIGVNFIL